ncbi:hypothetical protein [Methylogaea oryzae]|nr:hypothetical protein [Methylogaea oryzae]
MIFTGWSTAGTRGETQMAAVGDSTQGAASLNASGEKPARHNKASSPAPRRDAPLEAGTVKPSVLGAGGVAAEIRIAFKWMAPECG